MEFRLRISTHAILHPEVLILTLSSFNFRTFDANTGKIETLVLWRSLPVSIPRIMFVARCALLVQTSCVHGHLNAWIPNLCGSCHGKLYSYLLECLKIIFILVLYAIFWIYEGKVTHGLAIHFFIHRHRLIGLFRLLPFRIDLPIFYTAFLFTFCLLVHTDNNFIAYLLLRFSPNFGTSSFACLFNYTFSSSDYTASNHTVINK
jgi:hypothetical protein